MKIFVYGLENTFWSNDVEENKEFLKDAEKKHESESRLRKTSLLLFCFFGLQFSYLTWGILQEKIMTTEYAIYRSANVDIHSVINQDLATLVPQRKLSGMKAS